MVLLLMASGQHINSNAESLEAVRLDHHCDDARVRFIEKSLLQLLQHVQLHVLVAAVVNQQQTKLHRLLSHAPVLPRMRYTQNTQKEVLMDCKPVAGFDYLARQGKFLKSKKAGYARMLQAFQTIIQAALHGGVVMQSENPVHGFKATPHNPPIPIHRSGGDSVLQRVLLTRRNEGRDKQCLRVPKSSWYQSNTTKRFQ